MTSSNANTTLPLLLIESRGRKRRQLLAQDFMGSAYGPDRSSRAFAGLIGSFMREAGQEHNLMDGFASLSVAGELRKNPAAKQQCS